MSRKPQLPSQIDLISAIARKFGRFPAKPRHMQAIVNAANAILAEFKRPDQIAANGAGLAAWLGSDDTGMSSKYLAAQLSSGKPDTDFAYPHDPDDFGRCYRMLRVCTDIAGNFQVIPDLPNPWPQLRTAWPELEKLWEEESPSGRCPRLYERLQTIIAEALKS